MPQLPLMYAHLWSNKRIGTLRTSGKSITLARHKCVIFKN